MKTYWFNGDYLLDPLGVFNVGMQAQKILVCANWETGEWVCMLFLKELNE